jgi:penicillin-binding protein 2
MSVIHAPSRPNMDSRILAFPAAMLVLLSVLFFRLWYFQVVRSQELTDRADATRSDEVTKPAPRGFIYDRNGELLAGLKPQIVVSVTYSQLDKKSDEVANLAAKLGLTEKVLRPKLENAKRTPSFPVPILIGVPSDLAESLADQRHDFPGVNVDLVPTRYYPDGTDYSHVLGVVRLPRKADLARLKALNIQPASFVGQSGVEKSYEKDLMGTAGKEVVDIDSKRHPIRVVKRENSVPGNDLVLSLDSKIQHLATQEMAEHNYAGAVVALDPKTGELLCMVSSPTFDQNLFQGGISKDAYQKLLDDPNTPLESRACDSSYSPGSTFKIVTSLAAYEKGIFDPDRPVDCEGAYHVGTAKFACLGHHGEITFHNALIKSCNTYFADLGDRTGATQLRKTCAEVGLGDLTHLDIGPETMGVVPTEAYLKKNKDRRWYRGDTVNFSIGQGYLRTSPLQMCDIAALVANEGVIYKPHLVRKISDPQRPASTTTVAPEVLHKVEASPTFWRTLKDALEGVIETGTAMRAQIPDVRWAGKTGSAEHGHKRLKNGSEPKTNSWFVGYAPAENPKIAICVLVENAGHGGEVAAPIARDVVADYLKRLAAKDQAAANAASKSLTSPSSSAGSPPPTLR